MPSGLSCFALFLSLCPSFFLCARCAESCGGCGGCYYSRCNYSRCLVPAFLSAYLLGARYSSDFAASQSVCLPASSLFWARIPGEYIPITSFQHVFSRNATTMHSRAGLSQSQSTFNFSRSVWNSSWSNCPSPFSSISLITL